MTESQRLEQMADEARSIFLRRKSLRFLECSIELLLTDMSPIQVAMLLRQQAIIVEEHV